MNKNKQSILDYAYYLFLDKEVKNTIRLHKILYFIYKLDVQKSLKLFDYTNDIFEAWSKGPVNRQAYSKIYKLKNLDPDSDEFYDLLDEIEGYDTRIDKNLCTQIHDIYKEHSTNDLIEISHDEAWQKVREGLGPNDPSDEKIDIELIKLSSKLKNELY